MKVTIPISVGELLDKISILEIKSTFTNNEYVANELKNLNEIYSTITAYTMEHMQKLREVNRKLWNVEDKLRELEREQKFDDEFIMLARNVYFLNDERARIKNEINEITHSNYKEVKLYSKY